MKKEIAMNTDLTFITNEKGQNLKERFEVLIKDTKFFDCLVGYFYASGFHAIYNEEDNDDMIYPHTNALVWG